jgi:hypothetical protein
MLSRLKWFNMALRGLMELGIVALGYWGIKPARTRAQRFY